MSRITINNKVFSAHSSIVINNGRVILDGTPVETADDEKRISIEVHGDVQDLQIDRCDTLLIQGAVGSVQTTSGDVRCGDVGGSVQTVSGDVCAKSIGGNVKTVSGDVCLG